MSTLSTYAFVTNEIVALLNLNVPAPGSESVVVVLKTDAKTTAAPEFNTFDVTLPSVYNFRFVLAVLVVLSVYDFTAFGVDAFVAFVSIESCNMTKPAVDVLPTYFSVTIINAALGSAPPISRSAQVFVPLLKMICAFGVNVDNPACLLTPKTAVSIPAIGEAPFKLKVSVS